MVTSAPNLMLYYYKFQPSRLLSGNRILLTFNFNFNLMHLKFMYEEVKEVFPIGIIYIMFVLHLLLMFSSRSP